MSSVHDLLEKDKEERIYIARALGYSDVVINKLKAAKSEIELTNIMISARRAM